MNFKKIILTTFFALFTMFFFVNLVKAAPPPMFTLTAAEAQGAGTNEFYEGRCFRVNINLHTNGSQTGGADAVIQYDNTNVTIVNNNCITAATSIYSDGLYDVYPATGNVVSATEISLSAYENPGNNYSNNALTLYGHFYILVDDPDPAFDLNFDYTPGSTVDTNVAELGTGNDIIASVEDLSLVLPTDSDLPYFDAYSPINGAIDVAVEAAISYNMKDDMSGVDNSTRAATVNQGSGAVAETVSSSCITTNANRVPQCSAIINPAGYFPYLQLISVYAEFCDLGDPTQHCTNTTWSFTTEDDVDAPYVENENPADGATGVATNTNIVFRIKDYKNNAGVIPGLGVDINTVVVVVDGITYTAAGPNVFTYAGSPENYQITIDPAVDFPENYLVTVSVDADDLHSAPANTMATHNYSFTTSDLDPPYIDNEAPAPDDVNVLAANNVVFQIHDTGTGVDLNNLFVDVAGVSYSLAGPNTFAVNTLSAPNDYEITIDPTSDFAAGQAILVKIQAQDLAAPINHMADYYYVFGAEGAAAGSCPACNSCCPACPPASSGGSCSGGGNTYVSPVITNINAVQVDESTVLVTWRSNRPGTSRVVFGTESVSSVTSGNNHGYSNTTIEEAFTRLEHSMLVSGLRPGEVYYFMPVSRISGREATGDQVAVAMKFETITKVEEVEVEVEKEVEKACPVVTLSCPSYGVLGWEEEKELNLSGVSLKTVNGFEYIPEVGEVVIDGTKALVLKGLAEANQTFVLTFDPQLAMGPVVADENGVWEYHLKEKIIDGKYTVQALIQDENGVLLSNDIGYFVVGSDLEKKIREDHIKDLSPKENKEKKEDIDYTWFMILSFSVFLLIIMNVFLYFRRIKK